jgi:hypothetical protein
VHLVGLKKRDEARKSRVRQVTMPRPARGACVCPGCCLTR